MQATATEIGTEVTFDTGDRAPAYFDRHDERQQEVSPVEGSGVVEFEGSSTGLLHVRVGRNKTYIVRPDEIVN